MKSCGKFQRLTVNRLFKTFKKPYGWGIPPSPVRSKVKIRCGDLLLLQLLWPSGSRLTTLFSRHNSNWLRFRCTCTATGYAASTCLHKKWLCSCVQGKTTDFIFLLFDISLRINDDVLLYMNSSSHDPRELIVLPLRTDCNFNHKTKKHSPGQDA